MLIDEYKTIKDPSEGIYKEKGSKFIAYAYPISSRDDVKAYVSLLRDEYYDARHHCFAWQLGLDGNNYRANDDGEPSGTAGKPILGQIRSQELTNILIVVVRYFGGTKLGVPGLIRAYREAAIDAITNATIVDRTLDAHYELKFDYGVMNDIMRIVKEENLKIRSQQFDLSCALVFSIRSSLAKQVIARIEKVESIDCNFLHII